MPPEKPFDGWCREHMFLYYGAVCPKCADSFVESLKRSFGSLRTSKFPPIHLRDSVYAEEINLGRLEDNTEKDREFLESCGITVD